MGFTAGDLELTGTAQVFFWVFGNWCVMPQYIVVNQSQLS